MRKKLFVLYFLVLGRRQESIKRGTSLQLDEEENTLTDGKEEVASAGLEETRAGFSGSGCD